MAYTDTFPNGYASKISFWAKELHNPDRNKLYVMAKIRYFMSKEEDRLDRIGYEKISKQEGKITRRMRMGFKR